jgi:hypothetical protein
MTVSERSFCATPYGMPALVGAGCEARWIRGARSGLHRLIRGIRSIEVDGSRASERNSPMVPEAVSSSRRAQRGDLRAFRAPRTIEQPEAIGARSVRYIASHHFDRGLMLGKGSRLMLEVRSA